MGYPGLITDSGLGLPQRKLTPEQASFCLQLDRPYG
jgi:hypothetical protein